ncbi:alpha/beta hydrolase [Neptunomonas antarctica]|uniref:Lysophospholipase, alpha-beta hydrolase superfamily n=1 Tax=Neptunomonas antarctica TaxID=619304 RepID=A0A1N7J2F8_9GAMM|nr:alpha/beta fold hydrolase [Neptunomonas antarctica]SIS43489.1 Lysophospholipase, alpha-beta hydrolase superfamily [Neptunomonas antarctica]
MQGFNAAALRHSLKTFRQGDFFEPDAAWLSYFTLYNLAPLRARYQLSLGIVTCGTFELVVQHYTQKGSSRGRSKGNIVLVHGYMDHVGLYSKLIGYLLEQGWDVLCYDLPGHGLSSGDSYAIDHFSQYAEQLEHILHYQVLDGPCVLIGQSTGGSIVMAHQYLFGDGENKVNYRILLAPLIRPAQYELIRFKYFILRFFLKRVRRIHSTNSHDTDFIRFVRFQDPLQDKWVAVNWIGAMLEWVELIESGPCKDGPITVIQGTDDKTVDGQHNVQVLRQLYSEIDVLLVDGGRHHLANEGLVWREQVFSKIQNVLKQIS